MKPYKFHEALNMMVSKGSKFWTDGLHPDSFYAYDPFTNLILFYQDESRAQETSSTISELLSWDWYLTKEGEK